MAKYSAEITKFTDLNCILGQQSLKTLADLQASLIST